MKIVFEMNKPRFSSYEKKGIEYHPETVIAEEEAYEELTEVVESSST